MPMLRMVKSENKIKWPKRCLAVNLAGDQKMPLAKPNFGFD